MTVVLHLPFPPSVNSANGFGSKGYYPRESKKAFFRDADGLYMEQKRSLRGLEVKGPFTYHIVLNSSRRRSNADGDNYCKYVLDFAQHVGLIENDKLAEGGSWSWGPCEHGSMLSIHRVPETAKGDAEVA